MIQYEDEDKTRQPDDNRYISGDQKITIDVFGYGKLQSFQCPNCGSWNTMQGAYFDYCKTCQWEDGY